MIYTYVYTCIHTKMVMHLNIYKAFMFIYVHLRMHVQILCMLIMT